MKYDTTPVKHAVIICMCLISYANVSSQDPPKLSPEVLSSGGDHFITSEIKLDFTLGEFAVETIGDDPQTTQGFHQGELKVSTLVIDPLVKNLLTVYPNPTRTSVQVELKNTTGSQLLLFDTFGRLWVKNEFRKAASVDVSALPQGIYFLQIMSDKELIASSKIEKIH